MPSQDIRFSSITRNPSDHSSIDGELAEAVNLISENKELVPVLAPEELFDCPGDLLYIHKINTTSYYIINDSGTLKAFYRSNDINTFVTYEADISSIFGEIKEINSLGNTLIVLSTTGVFYLLFKQGNYIYLGDELPFVNIQFGLDPDEFVSNQFADNAIIGTDDTSQDEFYEMLQSLAEVDTATSREENKFYAPFLVRYGYRLYDGSVSKLSPPILLIPNESSSPCYSYQIYDAGVAEVLQGAVGVKASTLQYSILDNIELDNFSDIVTGIVFYSSLPITSHDADSVNDFATVSTNIKGYQKEGISTSYLFDDDNAEYSLGAEYGYAYPDLANAQYSIYEEIDTEVFNEKVRTTSSFYLISEIDTVNLDIPDEGDTNLTLVDLPIDDDVIENLGAIDANLLEDELNSHNDLLAETSYIYNSRLNLANIQSKFFGGFNASVQFPQCGQLTHTAIHDYSDIRAYIVLDFSTNSSDPISVVNSRQIFSAGGLVQLSFEYISQYVYYPDTRATNLILQRTNNLGVVEYAEFDMEEHTGLNGSVWFGGITELTSAWSSTVPSGFTVESTDPPLLETSPDEDLVEILPNKIYASDVDNPFVFSAEGRSTIGNGEIMRISSATKALSQGQFGAFPLYVFSTDGVWSLEVGSDGAYTSKNPTSRDICNNADSVTQIDGAIVFTSDKGLLIIQGSDVINLSEILNGKIFKSTSLEGIVGVSGDNVYTEFNDLVTDVTPSADVSFLDYIKECIIAYDYNNSRLIISNVNFDYQYLYSLGNSTYCKLYFDKRLRAVINNYPYSYIQEYDGSEGAGGMLFNISPTVDINDITDRVKGFIVSRPIDFGEPDILKTIYRFLMRGSYLKGSAMSTSNSYVKTALYGSTDGINYYKLTSLRGKGLKFFRIVLYANLLPVEKISKSTFSFDIRQTNKIR